jgi:S1-C subfamily serine protease
LVLRRAGVDPFNPPPRKNFGAVFSVRKGSMSNMRVDSKPAPPVVDSLTPGGAAARAGVRRGDIVASLNGIPITHFIELLEALRTVPLHRPVPLLVLRGGQETRLTVSFDSVSEPSAK